MAGPDIKTFTRELGGKTLTIETGASPDLAGGAVWIRYGDTVVLCTATMARTPRPGMDFFPLTIDFEEKMYAAGKIPGSFFRREGAAFDRSDPERAADGPAAAPALPEGHAQRGAGRHHRDGRRQGERPGRAGHGRRVGRAVASPTSRSRGRSSSVRVGYIDGKYVVNPTFEQLEESLIDIVVAGTQNAIMMVEAGANEAPEEIILGAMEFAQQQNQILIELQEEMVAALKPVKWEFTPVAVPEELKEQGVRRPGGQRRGVPGAGEGRAAGRARRRTRRRSSRSTARSTREKAVGEALDAFMKKTVRESILNDDKRPDGRKSTKCGRSGARWACCRASTARGCSRAGRRRC